MSVLVVPCHFGELTLNLYLFIGFCVGDDVFGDVGFLDFGVGQVHVAGVVFV